MSARRVRLALAAAAAVLLAALAFGLAGGPAALLRAAISGPAGAALASDDEDGNDDDSGEDGDGGEDDDEDDEPLPLVGGAPAVRLDAERRELAGVTAARLEPASLTPTLLAAAESVNIQPLAALRDAWRERFFAARAADVAVAAARREHERLDALFRDRADVAEKEVSRAEAAWRTARAERDRLGAVLDALRARAAREWGPALAAWAFAADDSRFAALAAGADSLLRAALPAGAAGADGLRNAELERPGAPLPLVYVSPAPRPAADGAPAPAAGESHFFLAPGLALPAGHRVGARVARGGGPLSGVALPPAAVVRAMGRDWAYTRLDERHFVRREVALLGVLPDGRYLAGGLEPGAAAVVVGAPILYAEEFRSQIRDEDDDD